MQETWGNLATRASVALSVATRKTTRHGGNESRQECWKVETDLSKTSFAVKHSTHRRGVFQILTVLLEGGGSFPWPQFVLKMCNAYLSHRDIIQQHLFSNTFSPHILYGDINVTLKAHTVPSCPTILFTCKFNGATLEQRGLLLISHIMTHRWYLAYLLAQMWNLQRDPWRAVIALKGWFCLLSPPSSRAIFNFFSLTANMPPSFPGTDCNLPVSPIKRLSCF